MRPFSTQITGLTHHCPCRSSYLSPHLCHFPVQTPSAQYWVAIVESSSSTSRPYASMNRDREVVLFMSPQFSTSLQVLAGTTPARSTVSCSFFITFFVISSTTLFFTIKSAVMSSTETLNFNGGSNFVTSFSASCNTTRRSKQLHLDHGKMAVTVWSGSATHPSNCTLVLEITAQHPQYFPWEADVRRPGPDHTKADSLKYLRKVQHQGHSPSHRHFPHCALSSSFPTIRGVPLNAVLLLPKLPTIVSTSASAQSVSHS